MCTDRVRDKRVIGFATPVFSSYANSTAMKCLTKTSCSVKERSGSSCGRPSTPSFKSGVAVNTSIR